MRSVHDTLDWNLLRTFVSIVQEKSISRAAQRLNLSQPAVSLALKRLESHLGQSLIERGSHRFRVTEAGELVYRDALEIYANVARLGITVRETSPEVAGQVTLLLVSGIQCSFLDNVLRDFHEQHPRITCEVSVLSSQDVVQAMLQKMGTVGVCLLPHPVEGLNGQLLVHQRYRFYCGHSHRLFGQQNLSLQALAREPFVSFTSAQLSGALAEIAVYRAHAAMTGEVVVTSSSLEEIQRFVRTGWGIGCLPEHTVQADVDKGLLWPLPPYEGVPNIDLHLVWHEDSRFSQAERLFFDYLHGAMASVSLEQRLP
ncbi:LysR family transcriptional regulator [Halomonas alkalicola]|uniref:LysR family transcriptional regulator n=1 Tax=Halomonas alkalicola TaxID=1930622 RepID=A0ABY9H8I6_9GAMM|nr:LysR family transcriptional regulator [Halomonas alkalicola]WLI73875.1 LysR family transcriptional regulator [Halomonas alkalicola]